MPVFASLKLSGDNSAHWFMLKFNIFKVFSVSVKRKRLVLCLLLQLEEGHGSVGRKKDIHAVSLHASAVALHGCVILTLFEIIISLKDKHTPEHII